MLTCARLKAIIDYDPKTGAMTNKVRRSQRSGIGDPAGSVNHDGYIRIKIEGRNYMAHRLAWLYVHGTWPAMRVDHRNGNPADNRIRNLRLATNSENRQNLHKAHKNNLSGLLGVSRNGNNWAATIKINGKRIGLGTYKTAEAAHAVYLVAKRELHHANTI
jgi:hypothetical protein